MPASGSTTSESATARLSQSSSVKMSPCLKENRGPSAYASRFEPERSKALTLQSVSSSMPCTRWEPMKPLAPRIRIFISCPPCDERGLLASAPSP
ncbi:MAG: hypothetical protein BWY99_02845 [Synergistetes bacterium ADurb.BinA166]|nr:MAG: hypothetical protein BWY99_02845 [Synergistetes bacterium ADurb.BinA166]